jgi:hypothetical protein
VSRKDGRPRVAVPLGLDPLPWLSIVPPGKGIKGRNRWKTETEPPVASNAMGRVFAPRDGYSQNEEDYK